MEDNNLPMPRSARNIDTAFYILNAFLTLLTLPVTIFFCVQNVPSYECLVVWRHGHLRRKVHGPGLYFIWPLLDVWKRLDMRLTTLEVPKLDLVTRDGIAVKIDYIVCYKILDAISCVLKTADVNKSIEAVTRTVLRDIIAMRRFSEMFAMKAKMSQEIQDTLQVQAIRWGTGIQFFNIKNIRLSPMLEAALFFEVTKFVPTEIIQSPYMESNESKVSGLTWISLNPSYKGAIPNSTSGFTWASLNPSYKTAIPNTTSGLTFISLNPSYKEAI